MKNYISSLFGLAIASVAAFPMSVLAAPATGSPYYTDASNSYVQDQTSQVMGSLNNILCYMGAMAPSMMVGVGDYIALIDQNVCESSGSGGQSGNTGSAYTATVVNSTRVSTSDPMKVKAWVSPQPGSDIRVYATATQAPDASKPYGVFNMNFCGMSGSTCDMSDRGFIDASSTGVLTFYSTGTHGSESETTQLQLTAPSPTSGSGVINEVATRNFNNSPVNLNFSFAFAYDADYFIRTTDEVGAVAQCFDRRPAQAAESVWRYGLYDATSGARINRKSGFPIEYTVAGVTSNGYIGYYGLWTQGVGPTSGDTIQKVTYSNNSAAKTPFTLYKTGGKLMKYTTANKTLADLNKVTFWYRAPVSIAVTGATVGATSFPTMIGGSDYELYWNGTTFMLSGQKGTSGNMEPLTTHGSIANSDMVTANPWGLWGWSQMMGGQFGIKGDDFKALMTPTVAIPTPSAIPVKTQSQDVVYPKDFANLGSLTCINDCPTAASITSSNGDTTGATSAFPLATAGWSAVVATNFYTYTLDSTSGNLLDATSTSPTTGVVTSTMTTGNNQYGIRSGRLVTATDATAMMAAKDASGVCGGVTTPGACLSFGYNQGDIDFLPTGKSYYVWETGGQPWNQIAYLMSQATPPVLELFDAPMQVSYTVPANTDLVHMKPYGNLAGSKITLQYGGFGDLWGIPNKCIDVSTNAVCDFNQPALYQYLNFRWTPDFSIPCSTTANAACDGTAGEVTDNSTTPPTTYMVKALDKEVRLRNATLDTPNPCTAAGLTPPAVSTLALSGNFVDPSTNVGPKPTVTNEPRIIHGVKQY